MSKRTPRRSEDRRVFANPNRLNRRAVRRVVDTALDGDYTALDGVSAPRYVLHAPAWIGDPGEEVPGFDSKTANERRTPHYATALRAAFPDLETTVDDRFGAGDRVVSRFTMTGTHRGELFGVAGTDRRVTFTGTVIHRVADDAVVEEWAEFDADAIRRGIGAESR